MTAHLRKTRLEVNSPRAASKFEVFYMRRFFFLFFVCSPLIETDTWKTPWLICFALWFLPPDRSLGALAAGSPQQSMRNSPVLFCSIPADLYALSTRHRWICFASGPGELKIFKFSLLLISRIQEELGNTGRLHSFRICRASRARGIHMNLSRWHLAQRGQTKCNSQERIYLKWMYPLRGISHDGRIFSI